MKCPECKQENPDEARFCMGCGYQLTSSSIQSSGARSFDERINKIQRYLPKGLTDKILSEKDKIEGKRKQVTVVFCDMEGFTPMARNSVLRRHIPSWTRFMRS